MILILHFSQVYSEGEERVQEWPIELLDANPSSVKWTEARVIEVFCASISIARFYVGAI